MTVSSPERRSDFAMSSHFHSDLPEPRVRLRLQHDAHIFIGPGRADVLEGIAQTGSIAETGRRLGMSYQRAWSLVQAMNADFVRPLVDKQRGGQTGGGAVLTEAGQQVLQAYRRAEEQALQAAGPELAPIRQLLRA
ncbi:MAG: LysR family transcriptional regulator [Burkholderiaceae bacterium]